MYLTEDDEFDADTTTHCVHCDVELTWDAACKTRGVKHHDHFKQPKLGPILNGKTQVEKGNYIETICSGCNLLLTNKRHQMSVMMHNGGGYDMNLFLKDLEPQDKENVFILPKQSTKFYTIKIGKLSFKDTLKGQ